MSEPRRKFVAALLALIAASPAYALPWGIDLTDAEMVKAYERVMKPLPEGVMSQPNLLTPNAWRKDYMVSSAEGEALTSPIADPSDEAVQSLGKTMYHTYCEPCHGDGEKLGPVSTVGNYPAVATLAGENGRLQHLSDGHVYLTIRNGSLSKLMPSYGYAMNDHEMWALVAWMRHALPNAQHQVPVAETTTEGGEQ